MQVSDTKGCKRLCGALCALLRIVHSEAAYAVPSVFGDVVEPLSEKKPCVTTTSQLPLRTLPRGRQLSDVACAACSSPDHAALGAPCDAMLDFDCATLSGKCWDTSGCNCPSPQSAKMPPTNLHTMVVSLGVDWAAAVYWPCMLAVAALALAFSMRGGKHSHQCRLALRSNQSAPVLGCYIRRPLINAAGITPPTTALLMLSALATTVATQSAPPSGPPPPPRPGSEELDGWRRFPSLTNHTVQALTPQCIHGGDLPGHIGCVSVPRSGMVSGVRLPRASPSRGVLHGRGAVTFSGSAGFPDGLSATTCFALAATNGDGRLDVLVGSQLLLQQSDGSFVAAAGFPGSNADMPSVACGDVDGDGRLDVLTGSQLLLQQSNGSFVAAAGFPGGSAGTRPVALVKAHGSAMRHFTELATCQLLLVLLLGIFATHALQRKHNTCKTHRFTASEPQVAAKARYALFTGLLRTAAFPDKASLQAGLTEWHSDHAAAEATALSFTTAVRTSQVLHMINEALGAIMKWVGLPRPAPPNARLPQAAYASFWRGHRYVAGLCRCAQMAACFTGVVLGAGKASIESSSSQTFSNRSRGRLKRAAVPASACAAKQRTKVAWLVFGLLLTLAGKASAFSDKASLEDALDEWCADAAAAQATYGRISAWDVSAVSDLVLPSWPCRGSFDENLNAWDVSKVTNMQVRCCPRREP